MTETQPQRVVVFGFGYVGATLAAALVAQGLDVTVIEVNLDKIAAFNANKRLPFYEPNVDELLAQAQGSTFHLVSDVGAAELDVAIICVGTPADPRTGRPNMEYVHAAADVSVRCLRRGGLLIVRSTVPVGTTRSVGARHQAALAAKDIHVAFCPERTIQGKALQEITCLPQVVGGLTESATEAANAFWTRMGVHVVCVSTAGAAELVKLANNCHTDIIYGYGNQVALVAREHGLDPYEVIQACNLDYPRPDLNWPGYVGGGCLIKDPYIMLASLPPERSGELRIVAAARQANERYPRLVAESVQRDLHELFGENRRLTILFCGIAYKGQPTTDDVRGGPIDAFAQVFTGESSVRLGQDFLVSPQVIRSFGLEPTTLEAARQRDLDAVLFLNNHPGYAEVDLTTFCRRERPVYVLDSWRMFPRPPSTAAPQIVYRRLGDV